MEIWEGTSAATSCISTVRSRINCQHLLSPPVLLLLEKALYLLKVEFTDVICNLLISRSFTETVKDLLSDIGL
jgi:hypothetical protein